MLRLYGILLVLNVREVRKRRPVMVAGWHTRRALRFC